MAGGLFAISRRFWEEIGKYDPGMYVWGGEQYEISFKVMLMKKNMRQLNFLNVFNTKSLCMSTIWSVFNDSSDPDVVEVF